LPAELAKRSSVGARQIDPDGGCRFRLRRLRLGFPLADPNEASPAPTPSGGGPATYYRELMGFLAITRLPIKPMEGGPVRTNAVPAA
jgi:hypothetical protein